MSVVEALNTTGTFPELAIKNHSIRIETVRKILLNAGVVSIADLGCGDGKLIELLVSEPSVQRIVGLDTEQERLSKAQERVSIFDGADKVELVKGSLLDLDSYILGCEGVALVESIEHIAEDQVPQLTRDIFGHHQPGLVVVTTPDATKRLSEEKMRQRGHLFEWNIAEFHDWANGVAGNFPYATEVIQLSGPTFIRNTQVGVFRRLPV